MRNFKNKGMILGLLLLVFFCTVLLAIGCTPKDANLEPIKDAPVIGLSFDSLVVERWQRDMEIIVAEANELGYQVNVQIANEDIQKQRTQIEALVELGVDAIIVLPNDATALNEAIAKANRAGIPIIAYDRLIKSPGVDLYVSFDNESIGYELAARMLRQLMQQGKGRDFQAKSEEKNIVIINGDPKDNNALLLNQGFYRAIKGQAPAPVKVVHEVWANGWRERYAEEALRSVLAQDSRIDGVICANDMLAASAIKVLAEHNLAGTVPVVSQDAELSACQRVVMGTQLATVYKPINDLAKRAVALAIELAQDRPLEVEETLYNGFLEVPYERLDVIVVDRENMDEVIIDTGFHLKEDVYRFAP